MSIPEEEQASIELFIKKMRDFGGGNFPAANIRYESEKENEVFNNKHIQSLNNVIR